MNDKNGNELKVGDRVIATYSGTGVGLVSFVVKIDSGCAGVRDRADENYNRSGWYESSELELIPSPDPLAEATKAVVEAARKQNALGKIYAADETYPDHLAFPYLDAVEETDAAVDALQALEAKAVQG